MGLNEDLCALMRVRLLCNSVLAPGDRVEEGLRVMALCLPLEIRLRKGSGLWHCACPWR